MKKIIEILQKYSFNCENQAGDKLIVIEKSDFEKLAEEISGLFEQKHKCSCGVVLHDITMKCLNCWESHNYKQIN